MLLGLHGLKPPSFFDEVPEVWFICRGLSVFCTSFSVMVFFIGVIANLQEAVMAMVAPRLYVIQELSKLVQ